MPGYVGFSAVYDRLTEDVGYAKRADYLCTLLHSRGVRGGLLLDLACGTGSLTARLCEKGFEVIGVDASPEMLCAAREKLAPFGTRALLLCQDMTELDLYGTVDAAVCTLDSLNHLTEPDEVRETLRRVSLFLNPNGVFVFDVNTPYKHEKVLGERTFVYETDGVYCVWQNDYRPETRTVDIVLDIFTETPDGRYERAVDAFSERAYTDGELTAMLSAAGFRVEARYAELTFDAPAEDEERVFYVCKK